MLEPVEAMDFLALGTSETPAQEVSLAAGRGPSSPKRGDPKLLQPRPRLNVGEERQPCKGFPSGGNQEISGRRGDPLSEAHSEAHSDEGRAERPGPKVGIERPEGGRMPGFNASDTAAEEAGREPGFIVETQSRLTWAGAVPPVPPAWGSLDFNSSSLRERVGVCETGGTGAINQEAATR